MRLNLGAGSRPMRDAVNVDRVLPLPSKRTGDYIYESWDLDVTPWPWKDNSVEAIHARDLFEHIADPIAFMTECHRILMPGTTLWIRTPNVLLSLGDAFTDPTHKRFPTWNTFDYWIPGTRYYAEHNQAYGGVAFNVEERRADDGSMVVVLRKPHPLDMKEKGND